MKRLHFILQAIETTERILLPGKMWSSWQFRVDQGKERKIQDRETSRRLLSEARREDRRVWVNDLAGMMERMEHTEDGHTPRQVPVFGRRESGTSLGWVSGFWGSLGAWKLPVWGGLRRTGSGSRWLKIQICTEERVQGWNSTPGSHWDLEVDEILQGRAMGRGGACR